MALDEDKKKNGFSTKTILSRRTIAYYDSYPCTIDGYRFETVLNISQNETRMYYNIY